MIKFFRNIRKQLLGEGKTGRYFKYAIGEIVLVVIGILLALQINNVNESKKTRIFELKMLSEIRNEIVLDTAYFKMIKNRAQRLANGAMGLTQYYDVENPPIDSLEKHARNIVGYQFMYRKGAYEALKATGIDKVSNDSLRITLTNLYDFVLPRVNLMLVHSQSEYQDWHKHFSKIASLKLISDSLHTKSFTYVPRTDLYKNPEAAQILNGYVSLGKEGVSRVSSALIQSIFALELINRELEQHD
mgnify:CR=1 FL=1